MRPLCFPLSDTRRICSGNRVAHIFWILFLSYASCSTHARALSNSLNESYLAFLLGIYLVLLRRSRNIDCVR